MHSFFLEKYFLPLADLVTRNRTMRFYEFFKESQWWDIEHLRKHQDELIAETVRVAYTEVPFYKELYEKHGVKINSINCTGDLSRLPIVTKDGLRNNYPERCTRKTDWPWKEYSTSGSSGKPFAVRVDNYSLSQARALMFLRANYSGWNIGDPFIQTGVTPNRGIIKSVKDILLHVDYISAFNLTDSVLDRCLELMEKKKLRYVMGFPGSIYCMAVRATEVGLGHKLDGVVTWGDNLFSHYRNKIEQTFKCRVTDTYGCGEGIQIAAQCGENNGAYHVFMPHVAVEIVDENGIPVKPGQPGNVLLTRLDPGATPLIRYRVGDIAIKSPDDACPCGRGMEMLTKIEGRDTDVVLTPNGNRLIVHFFTGIFEYYPSIDSFKVIQDKRGEIIIEIVPRKDFRDEICEQIKKEIWGKGDPELQINIELVDEIPLEKSNKRRFVVSRIT